MLGGGRALIRLKMATTYVLRHEGENGHPEVCESQITYLNSVGRNYEVLNWGNTLPNFGDNIKKTRKRLSKLPIRHPAIFLNGNGYLHGRTFFLVDMLNQDLDYFQVDAHADISFETEDVAKFDTHAFKTHELAHVKKMFMLGLNPLNLLDTLGYEEYLDDEFFGDFKYSPSPALYNPKVELFIAMPWGEFQRQLGAKARNLDSCKREIQLARIFGRKFLRYKEFSPQSSETPNAYISIDLDAVRDFPTKWPKAGLWTIEQVIETVNQIGSCKRIIGADICGFDLCPNHNPIDEERKTKALEGIVRIHDCLIEAMDLVA